MLSDDYNYQINIYQKIINNYTYGSLATSHASFLYKLRDQCNFHPIVCYDIGSEVLHWTRTAKSIWPNCEIILFDAFQPNEILYGNYKYNIQLLSDIDNKEIKFYQNDLYPAGNSYYREIGSTNNVFPEDIYIIKKSRTLDSLVKEKNYPLPDLIKIDVQGAELDVIKGSLEVLKHTKMIIVEMQHIEYNQGAPTVNITKPYIESLGWTCIAEKFSDNGADADYCFINNNLVTLV